MMYESYARLLVAVYHHPKHHIEKIAGELRLEDVIAVDKAIADLSKIDRQFAVRFPIIIQKSFGIDCKKMTLEEIGRSLEKVITGDRVRQLKADALRLMRKNDHMRPLVVYLAEQGLKGRYSNQTLSLISPEQTQSLQVATFKKQPAGTFLFDHFPGCSFENPCPTCQAKVVLSNASLFDVVIEFAELWQEGHKTSWKSVSVDTFDFSVRTANCLKNERITTLGELVQKSEKELLRTPNFGQKCLNELKAKLTELGLNLRDS